MPVVPIKKDNILLDACHITKDERETKVKCSFTEDPFIFNDIGETLLDVNVNVEYQGEWEHEVVVVDTGGARKTPFGWEPNEEEVGIECSNFIAAIRDDKNDEKIKINKKKDKIEFLKLLEETDEFEPQGEYVEDEIEIDYLGKANNPFAQDKVFKFYKIRKCIWSSNEPDEDWEDAERQYTEALYGKPDYGPPY